jgi:hypothetical protein
MTEEGDGAHLKCGASDAIEEPGLLGRLTSGRWSPLAAEGGRGGRREARPGDGAVLGFVWSLWIRERH